MDHVFQDALPSAPWMAEATRRLPGVQPMADPGGWITRDEAFAGQMALRDRLVQERRDKVLAACDGAEAAVAEMYGAVLEVLAGREGYTMGDAWCLRPDGVEVPLDPGDPLGTVLRLVQEDLCVLERVGDAHVLRAAALCFPASWTLAEKIGRPMAAIHGPVASYDAEMARRVQRLFDLLRVGQPLWRQNALIYAVPDLHHPLPEASPRQEREGGGYLRSERQVLLRLPKTGAVVFSIHTHVVRLEHLTPEQRAGLDALGQRR